MSRNKKAYAAPLIGCIEPRRRLDTNEGSIAKGATSFKVNSFGKIDTPFHDSMRCSLL